MNKYGNRALVVIASVAVVFLLYWGQPFFIPLMVALMISYALSSVTDLLTRVLRFRVLAASVVVLGLLGLGGSAIYAWSDDVAMLWQRIPEAARAISTSFRQFAQKPTSPMAEVKKAAADIESIAQTGKPAAPAASAPPPAQPSSTPFWELVWQGGKTAAAAVAQVMVVIFLVFFMLASGDLFKRKLVRMFGTTLSEKKITVQTIDEIDAQIRRYLVVVLVSNIMVGLGTYIAFRVMGVNYPELWALFAAIVHTAPYFGPAIVAAGSLLAAFVQFHSWSHAFAVSGATIVIAALVGSGFATWLSARQTRMNTTATFVGLLFFGWIWGLWGILLAIPILAIVKAICDRSDALAPVSELLSREEPVKRLPVEEEKNSTTRSTDQPARS